MLNEEFDSLCFTEYDGNDYEAHNEFMDAEAMETTLDDVNDMMGAC